MVKHIVMWRLKEERQAEKQEIALQAQKVLVELQDKISVLNRIEVGINYNPSESAYDIVLYSEFDSKEDLEIYQKHPAHVEVAVFIGQITQSRAVVDYEL